MTNSTAVRLSIVNGTAGHDVLSAALNAAPALSPERVAALGRVIGLGGPRTTRHTPQSTTNRKA